MDKAYVFPYSMKLKKLGLVLIKILPYDLGISKTSVEAYTN